MSKTALFTTQALCGQSGSPAFAVAQLARLFSAAAYTVALVSPAGAAPAPATLSQQLAGRFGVKIDVIYIYNSNNSSFAPQAPEAGALCFTAGSGDAFPAAEHGLQALDISAVLANPSLLPQAAAQHLAPACSAAQRATLYQSYARSVVDERHALQHDISQREFWLENLRLEFEDINARCRDHEAHIARLTAALDSVQSSWAWRLTWPLRYIAGRFGKKKPATPEPMPDATTTDTESNPAEAPPLILTPPAGTAPAPADVSISFIIPTFNGKAHLEELLPLLAAQQGFAETEIVVVDSGSSDGSAELAAAQGARLIQIPNSAFTHAHARNLGAENAKGSILLFITQDALPTGLHWARRMVQPLLDGKAVAASCAETPRPDAGLYAKLGIWHHTRFLGIEGTDRLTAATGSEDYLEVRKNAQLNDVACAIDAQLFRQYRYQGSYAEDLDLGLRLVQGGHQLALLASEQVIHSHNRSLYYTLSRSYVDNLALARILPGYPMPQHTLAETTALAIHGWRQFCLLRDSLHSLPAAPVSIQALSLQMETFKTSLPLFPAASCTAQPLQASGDAQLDDILLGLHKIYLQQPPAAPNMAEAYDNYYRAILLPYLQAFYTEVSADDVQEILTCYAKYYASTLGVLLAAHQLHHPEDNTLAALAAPLSQGI